MTNSLALALSSMLFSTFIQQEACENLSSLSLPNTTIQSAQIEPAGPHNLDGNVPSAGQEAFLLPEHCRVTVILRPSTDSRIEVNLWMPTPEHWNGKFLAAGNGGWAGSISVNAIVEGVAEGYATASNDTGHKGSGGRFALGHPEKLVDFAYRAMHEMTVQSKAIIERYYNQPASLSYYEGCSTGGRQGLMAVQRYPADFDAVIAGAPVNSMIYLDASHMRRATFMASDPANLISREKLRLVSESVTNACDALDGLKDGLLTDPRACNVDVTTLTCSTDDRTSCLTPNQVASVQFSYSDTMRSDDELIFPGFAVGGEAGWVHTSINETSGIPGGSEIAVDMFRYVGHQDPQWDWKEFDLEEDLNLALENGGYIDALETDLSAFKARGGKLLLYHGWNDQRVPPDNTINYYTKILETMQGDQSEWIRLFMIPGMQHCRSGNGPNQLHYLSALERWHESDEEPGSITAFRVRDNQVDMTRPVCAYPLVAKWTGIGTTNDESNFACEMP